MSTRAVSADPPSLGARGDVLYVAGTLVPAEWVIWLFRDEHASPESIAIGAQVSLADVYSVISYYLSHRDELDAYVDHRLGAEREASDAHGRARQRQELASVLRSGTAALRAGDPESAARL